MLKIRYILVTFFLSGGMMQAQNVLTIDKALELALKNNFDIRVAANENDIAKTNNTAGNAGMLPRFGVTASGSFSQDNLNKQTTSGGTQNNYSNATHFSGSAGLQLDWNLFDGGKMFVTKSKLNEMQVLGGIQYKEKIMSVISDVIAAYYDVVRQKQQLSSIQESLNFNRERLIISEAGLKAGSLTKNDWLQAKIDLNVMTENRVNQEFNVEKAIQQLRVLLVVKSDSALTLTDSIPVNYHPDKAELLQKVGKSNTQILGWQKQVDIAALLLKENQSLYLPTLSLRGGYYISHSDNSVGSMLKSNIIGPQVAGTLAIPIYNAGETKRKAAVARIEELSATTNLENAKLQINTELKNTLTEFDNQRQLLKIESENNQLAKENIQISLDRLKQGQATSLEVRQAQEDYVLSCTRLINFRYNLKMAETKIKQIIAEL